MAVLKAAFRKEMKQILKDIPPEILSSQGTSSALKILSSPQFQRSNVPS